LKGCGKQLTNGLTCGHVVAASGQVIRCRTCAFSQDGEAPRREKFDQQEKRGKYRARPRHRCGKTTPPSRRGPVPK